MLFYVPFFTSTRLSIPTQHMKEEVGSLKAKEGVVTPNVLLLSQMFSSSNNNSCSGSVETR